MIKEVKNTSPWIYVIISEEINREEIAKELQKELQKQIKNTLELKK